MENFKKIYLGNGLFSLVDNCVYEELNKHTWWATKGNYAATKIDGLTVLMHRYIMNLFDDDLVIDHIDGHRLDNRKINLRICTQYENMGNKMPRRNCTSIYNGVHFSGREQKWLAKITTTIDNKRLWCNIGFFEKEEEAAFAYNIVAKELRSDFAKLNEVKTFPDLKFNKRSLKILRKRLNIKLENLDK